MTTPQMSYPPPPPPGKKTSPIVWILIALGSIFFLCLLAVGIGGYFFMHKVKQVAGGNPAGIVRMIAAMNPDVEVVSSDEGSGRVTIRNKRDGKVVTLNFEDVKNGKFSFQEDGKDAVSIHANGKDGQGTVEVKSAEGTAVYGAGSTRIPAWVPAYPGSSPQGNFSTRNAEGETGSYTFKAKDSMEKVSRYYQDSLKSAGFEVETAAAGAGVITAKKNGERRTVVITMSGDGGETTVSVMFTDKT